MKLLALGDFHIDPKQPENRIDDYWAAVTRKWIFCLETAIARDAAFIIPPGDFTNTPSLPYSAYTEILSISQERLHGGLTLLTTFGQHDMRYRNENNTALIALETALRPFFKIMSADQEPYVAGDVAFYGAAYGEEVPEIDQSQKRFNVLIVHRMIIEEKLWSKQEQYEPSNVFLRQHPFDLIISGDNHHPFITATKGGRTLINCGAMMRSGIDQIDHKPFVVLFDTKTKEYEKIFLPIEDGKTVFQIEKVVAEKQRNENLDAFIANLPTQKEAGSVFAEDLQIYLQQNDIEEGVKGIISDAMKE